MRNSRRVLFTVITVAFLTAGFLLASCSNSTEDSGNEATVTINVRSKYATSRTALPSIEFEDYIYSIVATSGGSKRILAENLEISDLSKQKFTITRSVWIFKVQAYERMSKNLVLEGESAKVDLDKSENVQINMVLRASKSGVGSIKIPVNYDKASVTTVKAALYTDPTATTLATDEDGNTFPEKVFTKADGITSNEDGTYSLVYEQSGIPSGETYYAKVSLYDVNGVCVGTYTEAVYVANGLTSSPVIYAQKEDGTYETDEFGNLVEDETKTEVQMQANLYTSAITAEKGKTVIATDSNGNDYVLTDEDGDGIYDAELPPGEYTVKVGDTPETAMVIEDAKLDVGTGGGVVSTLKLDAVKVISSSEDGKYRVGNTFTLQAKTNDGENVTVWGDEFTAWWYVWTDSNSDGKVSGDELTLIENAAEAAGENESAAGDGNATDDSAKSAEFVCTPSYAGKYIVASCKQIFNGDPFVLKTEAILVEKGVLNTSKVEVSYVGEVPVIGDDLDKDNIVIEGLLDEDGNEITDLSAKFENPIVPETSGTVRIVISSPGYEDTTVETYLEVRYPAPSAQTVPSFVEDVAHLTYGTVRFNLNSADEGVFEYSVGVSEDGEKIWLPLTDEKIVLPVSEDGKPISAIEIRYAEVGTLGENGYVAPSDGFSLPILKANIGERFELASVALPEILKVSENASTTVIDENDETVTEGIVYEWYTASSSDAAEASWERIKAESGENYALSNYTPKVLDLGKYIAVKVRYAMTSDIGPDKYVQTISQAAIAKGTLPEGALVATYDAVVIVGGKVQPSSVVVKDSDGNELTQGTDYTISVPDEAILASDDVSVVITVPGYEDYTATAFVSVNAPKPESVPSLSTEIEKITGGFIKFDLDEDDAGVYEYSLDGEETPDDQKEWFDLTSDQFAIPMATSSVYVRIKAVGTEGEKGYIGESESVVVTVTEANRGNKPALRISVLISGDISVSKTVDGSMVTLTASTGFTNYEWEWELDSVLSNTTGNVFTIDTSSLKVGEYTIVVTAKKNGLPHSATVKVSVTE